MLYSNGCLEFYAMRARALTCSLMSFVFDYCLFAQ